jgi:hypothetical protein
MEKSSTVFVGMDVHKESIDITLAEPGGEVRRLGQIGGDRGSLLKNGKETAVEGAQVGLRLRSRALRVLDLPRDQSLGTRPSSRRVATDR